MTSGFTGRLQGIPRWLREDAFGFLYWLGFLLVLEPDNALRAFNAGHAVSFGHESGRILVAALLGALVTPIVTAMTRRYPIVGHDRLRHLALHALAAFGLAFGLIVVSCFPAAWVYDAALLPTVPELRNQLISNWLLLAFVLAALSAIAQLVYFFDHKAVMIDPVAPSSVRHESGEPVGQSAVPAYLTRVSIKARGQLSYIELADVDWIETQGNYLALHAGAAEHLVRETSVKFEAQLDPARFVRVHRRTIVAVDRIRAIQPLGNGDAALTLVDGHELRISRNYRDALKERWVGDAQEFQRLAPTNKGKIAE